jgi:hypothetical protein
MGIFPEKKWYLLQDMASRRVQIRSRIPYFKNPARIL